MTVKELRQWLDEQESKISQAEQSVFGKFDDVKVYVWVRDHGYEDAIVHYSNESGIIFE